jgi:hypothetical protein
LLVTQDILFCDQHPAISTCLVARPMRERRAYGEVPPIFLMID